ncbi:MAG: hypothetical protein WD875_15650 [Pirellulales bacterium]
MNGLFAALALATGVLAQGATPEWKASYAEAYHAGRNGRRPVLVVIDKPAEAAYRVDQASFARGEVNADERALLANYELCHVDASTEYGQKIAKSFGATQFPYVAITDRRVDVLLVERTGRMSQDQWMATLAKYSTGERAEPVVCFT